MTLFHTGSTKGAKNKQQKEEEGTKQITNNVVGVTTSTATTTNTTTNTRSTATSPPNSNSNNKSHESTTSTNNIPHKRSNTYTFGRNIHIPSSNEGRSSLLSSVVQRSDSSLSNQAQTIDDMKQFINETSPASKIKYRVMDGNDISFQDTLHLKKFIKHEIKKSHIMDTTEC